MRWIVAVPQFGLQAKLLRDLCPHLRIDPDQVWREPAALSEVQQQQGEAETVRVVLGHDQRLLRWGQQPGTVIDVVVEAHGLRMRVSQNS